MRTENHNTQITNNMTKHLLLLGLAALTISVNAQVTITVDADADNRPISPYLYGRNGLIDNEKANYDASAIEIAREAGLRFVRQNDGNNSSKYNWSSKLACHPDWYNNVYDCDWSRTAAVLQKELPGVMTMFGFPLSGKVAKTKSQNFNDWEYNESKWGSWCSTNMCGGGSLDASGNVIKEGNPDLYLKDWPVDSAVAIYPYWRDELNLDMSQFKYWNMDNELEMWQWTHDDVVPTMTQEVLDAAIDRYIATAKAIRAIDPTVKLCGPVAGNEWTWYMPSGNVRLEDNEGSYCWLEYFIKRIVKAEAEAKMSLIDVFDIHFYPDDTKVDDVLQCQRVLFDREYDYPLANGLKTLNGGWEELSKEYIFGRCQDWFDKYSGGKREMTYSISEYNIKSNDNPMVTALSYASFMGEGMRNGMDFFTPWTWYPVMWETLHLFSRYNQETCVKAVSSNEEKLSAYTSVSTDRDSMTIILLNRDQTAEQTVDISLTNFDVEDGDYTTLQLSGLTDKNTQTFVSHTSNALRSGTASVKGNQLSVKVPALSMMAVMLKSSNGSDVEEFSSESLAIYPNPTSDRFFVSNTGNVKSVEIINAQGVVALKKTVDSSDDVELNVSGFEKGLYIVRIIISNGVKTNTVIID